MRYAWAFFFLAAAGRADVTVRRVTTMDGFGGGSTTESTERYKGADHRRDSVTRFGNAMMNKMAGGERAQITRVSEDQVFDLDHAKKTYRQRTVSEIGKMMEDAKARAAGGKGERAPTHRVTNSSIKVEPTGERKAVSGFPCERVRVTMVMEIEDLKTKAKAETRMVSDNWNTPETAALKGLRAEEAAFWKAFAKKAGLDMSPEEGQRWGLGMAALLGVPESEMKEKLAGLKREFAGFKGYPVVTEISWYSKSSDAPAPAPHAKGKDDDALPDLSGGAAGLMGGLAAKMMERKMQASAESSRKRSTGETPLFSSRTELKGIESKGLDAGLFQVPAGFKKMEK